MWLRKKQPPPEVSVSMPKWLLKHVRERAEKEGSGYTDTAIIQRACLLFLKRCESEKVPIYVYHRTEAPFDAGHSEKMMDLTNADIVGMSDAAGLAWDEFVKQYDTSPAKGIKKLANIYEIPLKDFIINALIDYLSKGNQGFKIETVKNGEKPPYNVPSIDEDPCWIVPKQEQKSATALWDRELENSIRAKSHTGATAIDAPQKAPALPAGETPTEPVAQPASRQGAAQGWVEPYTGAQARDYIRGEEPGSRLVQAASAEERLARERLTVEGVPWRGSK